MADATQRQTRALPEPGSFRDWDGRVFTAGDRVLRGLTSRALDDWDALAASRLFAEYSSSGELVETRLAAPDEVAALEAADPSVQWAGALSHERVPFVSYPYEWTFSMLKDAALLQLRLTAAALEEGITLKDASPYNIQWRGARPVFIDMGSFERARPGEPWAAYRQFCMLYLYPLLLEAYRGVPFRPWLRGSVDGISPGDFRALFTRRDAFRRGMLRHVFLHAGLERRYADRGSEVREELEDAGFDARLVQANVAQLAKLVGGLQTRVSSRGWQDYESTCSYREAETAAKEDFVRRAAARRHRALVWDLGCNEGRYSRVAAEHSNYVIAVDSDPVPVDALYRALANEGNCSILPLVVDVADPSPAIGWRNRERSTLGDRGLPDLALCLALVHHLSISRNVPLREIVAWLRSLDCEVVVEFPHRNDPMVRRLLQLKRSDAHPDYERESFESFLEEQFEVVESIDLASEMRTLYFARPR